MGVVRRSRQGLSCRTWERGRGERRGGGGGGGGGGGRVVQVVLLDHFALTKEKKQMGFQNREWVSPSNMPCAHKGTENKTLKRINVVGFFFFFFRLQNVLSDKWEYSTTYEMKDLQL